MYYIHVVQFRRVQKGPVDRPPWICFHKRLWDAFIEVLDNTAWFLIEKKKVFMRKKRSTINGLLFLPGASVVCVWLCLLTERLKKLTSRIVKLQGKWCSPILICAMCILPRIFPVPTPVFFFYGGTSIDFIRCRGERKQSPRRHAMPETGIYAPSRKNVLSTTSIF